MTEVHNDHTTDVCSPLFVEYRLMKEFVLFQQQTIQNVYLIPSYESPFKWFGVLFVHEGLYQGAVLRFTFHIPVNYPECDNPYPSIFFDNPPFHPLVDPDSGKLDSTKLISEWNPRVHQFWQLIVYTKKAFIFVERELNYDVNENSQSPEDVHYLKVVNMYRDNQEFFVNKIAQTVETSKTLIYQPPKDKDDPHAIIFTEVDPATLESWKNRLLSLKHFKEDPSTKSTPSPSPSSLDNNNRSNMGLSWVQNDIPFSRTIV